ncbi:MAG TPA: diguanylate cyclase [Bacillota bacterium]|nr:diguanylate cyclase [Bacillota bacterium]
MYTFHGDKSLILPSLSMMHDGLIILDRESIITFVDDKFSLLLSESPDDIKGKCIRDTGAFDEAERICTAARIVHDEHRPTVISTISSADGMYFEIRMAPLGDEILVEFSNTTHKVLEKMRLKESDRSKEFFLANLPGMAYRRLYDRDWTMLYVSKGCFQMTGYYPESLIRSRDLSFNDLILPGYRTRIWEEWTEVLEKHDVFRGEYPITKVTGETVWVFEQGQGVYDEKGRVVTIEGLLIDVTASKERQFQIEYLLNHDALTGVYNRLAFSEKRKEYDENNILPVSVITCDIDGLKIINDAFGMATGDVLLKETARILARHLENGDFLARLGGDDFAVLLPNKTAEQAADMIDRIQEDTNEYNQRIDGNAKKIHISFGYATKELPDETIELVQKVAEENMNKQKLLEHKSLHSSIVASIKTTLLEKSQETKEHAERLAFLSRKMGEKMQLSKGDMNDLELFAVLHDIGKVGIKDKILNKPEPLTPEEWVEMRKHTEIGYRIAMSSPELIPIADYILSHHEKWDGTGYPQGLYGKEIPLAARILTVADAYDAMTQDRAYRKALSQEYALSEIEKNAGTQFDPEVVDVFVTLMREASAK